MVKVVSGLTEEALTPEDEMFELDEIIKLEELDLLEGRIITLEEARLDAGMLDTGDGTDESVSPAAVQLTMVAVESLPLPCTPKLCEVPGATLPFHATFRAV
jgi:hypothetical protein